MEQDFDVSRGGLGRRRVAGRDPRSRRGLKALVVEKTELVGGTSAISGGGIWIPDNHDMPKAGLRDSIDAAFRYVKACAKGLASDDRVLAYVETARHMARYLAQIGVPYRCMPTLFGLLPGHGRRAAWRAHHGSGRLQRRQAGR